MSLSKTRYPLFSTGSTQEDTNCPDMTEKLLSIYIILSCVLKETCHFVNSPYGLNKHPHRLYSNVRSGFLFVGMDVLNSAIESIYKRVPAEKWEFVSVAVAPSTITISEHGVSHVGRSFLILR